MDRVGSYAKKKSPALGPSVDGVIVPGFVKEVGEPFIEGRAMSRNKYYHMYYDDQFPQPGLILNICTRCGILENK